jgi:hypothetical protein
MFNYTISTKQIDFIKRLFSLVYLLRKKNQADNKIIELIPIKY